MTAISLKDVAFSYGEGAFRMKNFNLDVEEGEFLAVLGHNGSGKSTLARLMNGLLLPDGGTVEVFGTQLTEKNLYDIRRQVGVVFQNPDNQTVSSIVEDDVAFGAEKQRVAIAGVLALKPRALVLDESTAMLDPRGRREIMDVVTKLNREEHITVVLITHFMEEALLSTRAVVMNRGEIVMEGRPAEIFERHEELLTYNLTLPRIGEICKKLQKGGLNVPDTLDIATLADAIERELKIKN